MIDIKVIKLLIVWKSNANRLFFSCNDVEFLDPALEVRCLVSSSKESWNGNFKWRSQIVDRRSFLNSLVDEDEGFYIDSESMSIQLVIDRSERQGLELLVVTDKSWSWASSQLNRRHDWQVFLLEYDFFHRDVIVDGIVAAWDLSEKYEGKLFLISFVEDDILKHLGTSDEICYPAVEYLYVDY